MSRKVFRELVSVEEAKRRLRTHFTPKTVGAEAVSLERVHGRVLARDIEAPIDVPPFDRAAMDGFAVRARDTFGAEEDRPRTLRVVGRVCAGERPRLDVGEGEAVEVSTGSPVPKGANAVVMVEYTAPRGASVEVYGPVAPGENVMAAGSDIMAGELILRRGTPLTSRETGVLAALGLSSVEVFKRPRVAVLSTGNEIVPPGGPLEYGMIYDVNARALSDSVAECRGEPIPLGVVGDDAEAIGRKLREGLRVADVVLTSGGTSAGVGDLLYRLIDGLGKPGILVHGVSVKPGKPTIIAMVDGKPLFGLPGYPASALMIFDIFVSPILREMAGLEPEVERGVVEARTAERIHATEGRREYLPVNVVQDEEGGYIVYPVPGGSGAITSLAEADGFVVVPEERSFLEAGERVQVKLFSPELRPADLMVIGSHCLGVDIILELLSRRRPGIHTKVINVGSSGGLAAVRRGEADIAGTHLLDTETGEYNRPFLERFGIADMAVLVRGYDREQGLIVPKGNPKNVRGIEDLLRGDLTIINRNPGSGTRLLLDTLLRKRAEDRGLDLKKVVSTIPGYDSEAKSHSAVAVAVQQGKADVGLGIRTVAERYGLAFIPVARERYDFAIPIKRLERPPIRGFLEVLGSEEFKREVRRRVAGIIPTEETGTARYSPTETQPSSPRAHKP